MPNTVNDVPRAVTRGLFWAWVVNDLEELVTMGPWSRRHKDALAAMLPIPAPAWVRDGMSEAHVRLAIGIMGALMWGLAARGVATGGRSRLYQAGLLGFGVHGFTHLGNSVRWKGYTPGVLTAPTVVIPFSGYAGRELRRRGLLRLDAPTVALAALGLPGTIGGIHAGTAAILRAWARRSTTR